jgi:hypothetical protein
MEELNNIQRRDNDVSVGEWILTFILMGIPVINIILLFVWAFGGGAKPSKQNYAKASLIIALVMIVFVVLFLLTVGSTLFALFR